ncbi:hypothetical protein PCO86_02480 [Pectobacteriaceae bacterium CE70]|nr:hypothetical protein PCO87_02535 [Pectobacteriaceae bacterium C52]WJV67346.1 hypothetical protein PCO86_02480 [Pectobacteriaceae bacterium CE70]WJY11326.1 hypothetical protein PCO80_02480 [Pectobacteriaceae bacterium C80]
MRKNTGLAIFAAGALFAAGFSASAFAGPPGPGPWLGPGPGWWGPMWYPGPVVVVRPDPGPRVIYAPPPQPQVWVEKTPTYHYYCRHPTGYYPKIARCPSGWMKVVSDKP